MSMETDEGDLLSQHINVDSDGPGINTPNNLYLLELPPLYPTTLVGKLDNQDVTINDICEEENVSDYGGGSDNHVKEVRDIDDATEVVFFLG